MLSLLEILGGFVLIFALFKSAKERRSDKIVTVFVVITMYWVSMSIGSYFETWISEGSRIFVLRAFLELTLVLMLHLKPCRETVVIMCLSLCSVLINIIGFSVDVGGTNPDVIIDSTLMAVFYVMLAILISRRLANGCYRYINSVPGIHGYCVNYLKINSESK